MAICVLIMIWEGEDKLIGIISYLISRKINVTYNDKLCLAEKIIEILRFYIDDVNRFDRNIVNKTIHINEYDECAFLVISLSIDGMYIEHITKF